MKINWAKITPWLMGVLVIRLFLALFPSFAIDMNNWTAWSRMLGEAGISHFYLQPGWTDYTPGFLYYLWVLGTADKALHLGTTLYPFLIKLPVILADLGIGLLLYKIFLPKSRRLALAAFLAYTVNPVIIFTNSIWGQTDGLIALFILLSAYFLAQKKNTILACLFWVIALFIKPQSLVALPILLAYLFFTRKFKDTVVFILEAIVLILLIGLPFFIYKNPIWGMPQLISVMSHESPFTSVMAFNFWAITPGMWLPDSGTFLGVAYLFWGELMFGAALLAVIYQLWRSSKKPQALYLALGMGYLAFFLLSTRVHERYILVALPFLLLSAGLLASKLEWFLYFVVSLLALVNIYHPYAYYNPDSFLTVPALLNFTTATYKFMAVLLLLTFAAYWLRRRLAPYFNFRWPFPGKGTTLFSRQPARAIKLPPVAFSPRTLKWLLAGVVGFAFITRVAWLWSPPNEYFDEVYHAFTARQLLHGNPMVWEWWNTPPEGFAYEWTHPPLAKLGMWVGMTLLGENAFGWRLPGAILGTLAVYLIYLIAKEVFGDRLVGILAAAVFSLDGLPLVMSRIGMNDSYHLFFALLAIYLFIRQKDFLAAGAYGLALASKWSALWAIPILGVIWLTRKHKFTGSLLWFGFIPPLVYLATYIPMFTSGHSFAIFWEMQKQMWWYHTGLRATHPYTSPWWQWPFLIRPIYLYTSDEIGGMVARIYAFGNPFVFWFGFLSVLVSAIYAWMERNKKLALVIFGYFIFFVPWAASPRIMFLYHYLPSIPFLAIATGYLLRRKPKLIVPVLALFTIAFIYFYPHYAGLKIPLSLDTSYYWLTSWR